MLRIDGAWVNATADVHQRLFETGQSRTHGGGVLNYKDYRNYIGVYIGVSFRYEKDPSKATQIVIIIVIIIKIVVLIVTVIIIVIITMTVLAMIVRPRASFQEMCILVADLMRCLDAKQGGRLQANQNQSPNPPHQGNVKHTKHEDDPTQRLRFPCAGDHMSSIQYPDVLVLSSASLSKKPSAQLASPLVI